uniref:Uncharacterized protein n=1 Tax=Panagrolaimus sp. PS1159 TaxID=55785 RepID=A0AC35F1W9_9BILA
TELLSHNSNIGQRGKWTYRVDRASGLIPCPAGLLGAPLCQQDCPAGTWGFECINKCHCADNVPCDFGTGYCANSRCAPGFRGVNCYEDINECAEGVARCHHDAKCLNIPGGYECKCNSNFIGDGFSCVELDKCQIKYGQPCSPHGYCQISSPDEPYCTCNPGYIGDGNTCTRKEEEETTIKTTERFETSTVYTTWPTKTTGRIFVEPAVSESRSTEAVDEHPFVMNNWISAEVTAPSVPPPTTIASRPIITLTTRPKLPVQPKEPIGNEYTDIDNSIVEEATIEGDDDNYFTAVDSTT